MLRGVVVVGAALAAGLSARSAAAGDEEIYARRLELPHLAAGMRFGVLPPSLSLLEVSLRLPDDANRVGPAVTVSLAGALAPADWALGNGGFRTSVGGFLSFETRRSSGLYFSLGYLYYHAAPDSTGFWETDDFGYATFGWLRRDTYADFFIGGGLMVLLAEDGPPCAGFCVDPGAPPVLPTFDLGFRFHAAPSVRRD